MGQFSRLIEQIEGFITKYYKNEMVKGGILFTSVLLLSYGLVTTLEYLGRFGTEARLFMLLSFIVVNVFLLGRYLIIPLLKLNKVGRHLGLRRASLMIGLIFPEIADKLSNTLVLHESRQDTSLNLELVHASIEQRSAQLSVVPFSSAIDLRKNRKYLRLLMPILFVLSAIAILNPAIFKDGSDRIVNFTTEYVEPAPFEFILESYRQIKEGEDYVLQIRLEGDEIPDEVKVYSNLGNYNLIKKSKVLFEYTFSNLGENLSFYCEANSFKSKGFKVMALQRPVIEDIALEVLYPKHIGRRSEVFHNSGNVTVPEGTLVRWNVLARNLEELEVNFSDTSIFVSPSVSSNYGFQRKFFSSQSYNLIMSSSEVRNADSLFYSVSVVKDEYPTISITELEDSTNTFKRFVQGKISDDHGFKSLSASLEVVGKDTSYVIKKLLKVNPRSTTQLFSYHVDLSKFDLGPGDRVEYFFVVTDNDRVNGYKSSSCSRRIFSVPEMDELDNILSEQSDDLRREMNMALEHSQELKNKIESMKNSLLNKQNLDWKDRQGLEDLLNLQRELDLKIQKLRSGFEKDRNDQENYFKLDEEYLEKQEMLQELMNELMDEEMVELFEELEKLMEEMNKDRLLESLEEMKGETNSMEERMDRTLELFKNIELDRKLESVEEQLREVKDLQDELKGSTGNREFSNEKLAEMQQDINEKFDGIQEDMKEIERKNESLEAPRMLDFDEEQERQLDEELDNAKKNLEKNKMGRSERNQQSASDLMEEMADDIAAMQSQSDQQRQEEDMDALRYLLENVVALSKSQEDLMDEYQRTQVADPYYLELNREQLDLDRATDIVRDSLVALAKRVYQLSSYIADELDELNYNLERTLIFSEERSTNRLMQYQQYAMTDYNDLALMLSEVLDQMQKQAQSSLPGNGQCDKPGGSGQGAPGSTMSMQKMKDALKDQIGRMKGGKKPGGEQGKAEEGEGQGMIPGSGSIPGLSTKEQVRMAAQQARIRESLKKLKEELNKDGSGFGNGLDDLIRDLDRLEEDLLNGSVGTGFIGRQEDILTRLLENERAIRERGYSKERESNRGKDMEEGNQIRFTEYNRLKKAEVEFMRSIPIGLQIYYKTLANEYFNSVNN